MRASILISVLLPLPSAFATPLPFAIERPYQRRGYSFEIQSAEKTADHNTASTSSHFDLDKDLEAGPPFHSDSRGLPPGELPKPPPGIQTSWFQRLKDTWYPSNENPIHPDPSDTFPGEIPKPPPEVQATWFQKVKKKWGFSEEDTAIINNLWDEILHTEVEKLFGKAYEHIDFGAPMTVQKFADIMSAKNREIWEADSAALAAKVQEFRQDQNAKTLSFHAAQRSKAQEGPVNEEQAKRDATEFEAARAQEREQFRKEQEAQLERNSHRYQVVQEHVEKVKNAPSFAGAGDQGSVLYSLVAAGS